MENATVATMPNESFSWYHCGMNEWFRRIKTVFTVFYSFTCVFGIIGNGLVIFITGFRIKKTFTTVFFLNLAIADFIVTFFLVVTITFVLKHLAVMSSSMQLGKEMCQFINTVKLLNLYSSVYFLMVISIGRYVSVRFPVWARNHQTPRLASLVALGVWILSLGLSCAYLYSDRGWIYGPATLSESLRSCYGTYGSIYISMFYSSLPMFLSHVILSFILPFIVMISCYGATILRLRKSQFAQPGKPFKAITAVTVAFFLCWFPLNLMIFMKKPPWGKCVPVKVFFIICNVSGLLAYLNSCLNPILYVFIGRHYKETLRCSLLSTMENAFYEENSPGTTRTECNSAATAESQNL